LTLRNDSRTAFAAPLLGNFIAICLANQRFQSESNSQFNKRGIPFNIVPPKKRGADCHGQRVEHFFNNSSKP
jgi:hypothetical protein